MRRIIFVCNYAAEYKGNFIESLQALEDKLKAKGNDVSYIFPYAAMTKNWCKQIQEEKKSKCEFTVFSPTGLYQFFRAYPLEKNSVLHVHFGNAKNVLAIRSALFGRKDIKIVLHMHMRQNCESKSLKARAIFFVKSMIGRAVYKNIDMICVSPGTLKDARQYYPDSIIHGIYNAIHTDRLLGGENRHIPSDQCLIFGTDFYVKGVDLAIRAIEKSQYPLKLTIVTHSVEKTKQLITHEFGDVPNYVSIITPREKVVELFNNSFVFLSPSRSEAFAYAVAEAAYCGCQVIASDIDGQNVQKNIPGICWVKPNDVLSLTQAIEYAYIRAMGDDKTLKDENDAQKAVIEKTYSLEKWCADMVALFDQLEMKTN